MPNMARVTQGLANLTAEVKRLDKAIDGGKADSIVVHTDRLAVLTKAMAKLLK